MIYTVTQSKDPDMFEFWNEYTVAGKKRPMLCMIIHSDCLSIGLLESIKHALEQGDDAEVYFEVVK